MNFLSFFKRRRVQGLGISIVALGIALTVSNLHVFKALELKTFDSRLKMKSSPLIKEDIVLVGIDDLSIKTLGRWPWPRNYHALLIQALSIARPKVIGYDVLFTEKKADDELIKASKKAGNICHSYYFEFGRGDIPEKREGVHFLERASIPNVAGPLGGLLQADDIILPIAPLCEGASLGFINVPPEADGVFRSLPLIIRYKGKVYPSFSLRLVCEYLGCNLSDVYVEVGKRIILSGPEREIQIPVDEKGRLLINYAGVIKDFKGYSFVRALKLAKEGKWKKKGKLVLVAITATGISDTGPTPVSSLEPLIVVHANAINTILSGQFIRKIPSHLQWVLLVCLWLIVVSIGTFLRATRAVLAGILVLGLYISLALSFFINIGIWMEMVRPIAVILFTFLGLLSYRYIREEAQKRWVREAFGHYVSHGVLDEILKNPASLKLGGEKKNVSLLFADIRNFTRFSEGRDPQEVVGVLNEYLNEMTELILKNGGTLDKYIGDELVAIFGAPSAAAPQDHAMRAVRTALQMTSQIKLLQKRQGRQGLDMGIGINSGVAVVGNIGSKRIMDYTAIGDTVNLASRVEGLTRKYGVSIIITEDTYKIIRDKVEVKKLAQAKVKGLGRLVTVYELKGLAD